MTQECDNQPCLPCPALCVRRQDREMPKNVAAGLFLRENNFLLIDEPTNHLNMAARETGQSIYAAKSDSSLFHMIGRF